jgi:hypothetical protein
MIKRTGTGQNPILSKNAPLLWALTGLMLFALIRRNLKE